MLLNFLKWLGYTIFFSCLAWLVLYVLGTIAYYALHGIVFGP